ncbi:MAG TPA: alpha-amylase family glycosyl hydrolase [Vicinamibacteria bacterium]|nr:alpha-amylase family glycosyl hydrolase [Vicinamibacteria bacterium]
MIGAALLALLLAPPQVAKVEPPSWWPGHSTSTVRLLVRGRDLAGASVASAPGLRVVGEPRVSAAGTSLLVDVAVNAGAAPGERRLRLTTAQGSADFPFELRVPLSRDGRFQGFSTDDVVYLIMPDRFANGSAANDDAGPGRGLFDRGRGRYYHGGDLQGVIARLPYLQDLGITALWLTPVYDNVNHLNERETYDGAAITDYHGYGAVDFYAVDEHLGDLATYRRLVDAAHARGMKVVQDQVANHTGPYHPWVADPPKPTWYHGAAERHLANTWQTWTLVDPHSTPHVQRETLEGWFIDILPDLNQGDPDVSRYLVQNALWWVGMTGLDAIRQDTLPYVPRRFWADWSAALHREYPRLTLLGEMFDGDPALVSFFQGGVARDGIDTGIDTLVDFPLFFPLRRAFAEGKALRELPVMLAHDRLYPDASVLLTFAGLHDVPRFMNEHGATVAGRKLADTFLLTTRGTPLIYYGDEIGMPGGGDPDNRRDFPGGFPGDARDAFTAAGRTPDEAAVFDNLRRLARLRAELAPLRRGRLLNLAVGEQAWAYARMVGEEAVVVVLNNAAAPAVIEVPAAAVGWPEGAAAEDRLGGAPGRVEGGRLRVSLGARSAALFTRSR